MTREELLRANNESEERIAVFLHNYSEQNNWHQVEETQQPLRKCMLFIKGKARKLATDNVAMVEDNDVYTWAVEFYNTTGHNDNKGEAADHKNVKAVALEAKKEKERRAETEKAEKKARKDKEDGQMSMFDFLD